MLSRTNTSRKSWIVVYVFIMLLTCTFGASAFSISLGFFELSVFRALFLFLGCIYLLLLIFPEKSGFYFKLRSDFSFYILFWILWAVYAFASFFWSKDIGSWFVSFFYICVGLFFLLFFSTARFKLEYLILFFAAFNLSCFFQSIIGWFEVFTGTYFFLPKDRAISYAMARYPVATLWNTNNFATMLLAGVYSSLICICKSKHFVSKVFYFVCIIEYSVLTIFTSSRANLLSLAVGVVFCFLIRKHKRFGLVISITGGAVLILMIVMHAMTSTAGGSDNIRINLILDGFDFLVATYFMGIGAGQAEWWLRHRSSHAIYDIYNLHNWWVEILVCYGVIIFALYAFMYIKTFFIFFRKHNRNSFFDLNNICCGFLVAFAFSCMSSSSMVTCEWMWVFLPLMIALANSEDVKEVVK